MCSPIEGFSRQGHRQGSPIGPQGYPHSLDRQKDWRWELELGRSAFFRLAVRGMVSFMVSFEYLYRGLCGMANAPRANSMAGHLGAAVIAGIKKSCSP